MINRPCKYPLPLEKRERARAGTRLSGMLKFIPVRFPILLSALLLISCAADREPGSLFGPTADTQIVVDATLIVDHALPDLFVRRTLPPGQVYSQVLAAVVDAEVLIRQGDQVFPYAADPDSAGRYLPPENAPLVQPQTIYELEVRIVDRLVRAQTTTPGRLMLREAVVLDDENLVEERRLRLFSDSLKNLLKLVTPDRSSGTPPKPTSAPSTSSSATSSRVAASHR